jgi:dephospho-CoA kinase
MPLIYITGNAGAGKSTVCKELGQRGYEAYDIDENVITAWFDKATGEQVEYPKNDEQRTRAWNDAHAFKMIRSIIEQYADRAKNKLIFLCGQSIHDEEVWDLFDETIFLAVDKETLKYRLATRPGNVFGKTSGELAAIMEVHGPFQNKHSEHGALFIDGLLPVENVVDQIVHVMSEV